MYFNQRHLSPALGAQWTFAFCKLLIHYVRSDSPFTKRSGDMVYTSVLD
jgi:hypothetical protein